MIERDENVKMDENIIIKIKNSLLIID